MDPQRSDEQSRVGETTAPAVGVSAAAPVTTAAAAAAPVAAPSETDRAAEARAAAAQELEEEVRARCQAGAFGPRHSNAFAPPKHKPEFHWDYARTHRTEPFKGGLGVAGNINDHCALILFALFPIAGCAVAGSRMRGDLFEHMGDSPDPEQMRVP